MRIMRVTQITDVVKVSNGRRSVSGGRRPFGAGLSGGGSPHRPLRPRFKLPTQSQMGDGYLKVCVQNMKVFFT